MTDKITGVSRQVTQQPTRTGGRESVSQGASAGNATHSRASDSVSLTRSAEQMQRLLVTAEGNEAAETSRVEQIRLALESGDYRIDAQDIAERLLSLDRQMGD
ncbi:flagellar biosynthesis anti-sigma factor FlgM [Wenzhouxiangella sp. AB-CW3]|uniref:flagellar biosynthesis anti-sigma factor FlgM n=1 Tax=Wenzhouxiangella sp. AB-CW3 TaxID=2771012 RepID=UPI00168A59C0|nr:flagellar biosynthesis anti-sigma factor FlgM [Wenzhouxiangella sp. AB-CW3]QOC21231.1 flagellar biosynthesis anti-sigma factor FlgM [Wenzhouxiangella sp. AB-CW3]